MKTLLIVAVVAFLYWRLVRFVARCVRTRRDEFDGFAQQRYDNEGGLPYRPVQRLPDMKDTQP